MWHGGIGSVAAAARRDKKMEPEVIAAVVSSDNEFVLQPIKKTAMGNTPTQTNCSTTGQTPTPQGEKSFGVRVSTQNARPRPLLGGATSAINRSKAQAATRHHCAQ